jgi:hypothetical protein
MKRLLLALALGAFAVPGGAATTGATFDVGITLSPPGTPPPGGGGTPPPSGGGGAAAGSADFCISQSLSDATGAIVRVVCRSGQFVSIEAKPDGPFLGVHGGAFRYYFANGLPAHLRFLGGSNPWVGPGTVTSIRVKYLEDLDGIVEMQVGF